MRMGIFIMVIGIVITVVGAVLTFSGRETEKGKHREQITKTQSVSPRKEPVKIENPAKREDAKQSNGEKSIVKEDPKQKGNSFEGFVADILKSSSCRLLEWNQGTTSPSGAYGENELNPDFKVLQSARGSHLKYWLECKYRSDLSSEGFRLDNSQLSRYSGIQSDSHLKVIVALGVGGRPEKPLSVYLIPLDTIMRFKRIGHKFLPNYRLEDPETNFSRHMEEYFFEDVFKKKTRK